MKKAISLILALVMCLSLCSCGTSKFQETYTSKYDEIAQLYSDCSFVAALTYSVWNSIGGDRALYALNHMRAIGNGAQKTDGASRSSSTYPGFVDEAICRYFDWNLMSDFHLYTDLCQKYWTSLCEIRSLVDILDIELKEMRADYYNDFGTEFELLNDYWLEVVDFSEFVLNPSGGLRDFGNAISNYEKKIDKLDRSADIY